MKRSAAVGTVLTLSLAIAACSSPASQKSKNDEAAKKAVEKARLAVKKADDAYPEVPVPDSFRPLDNDCSGGYVYFTFDDGPNMYTDELLDRMKALHIKGTFFVLGQNVFGRETDLERQVAEGHRIENHSWDHTNFVTGKTPLGKQISPWGDTQIRSQVSRTQSVVKKVTGKAPDIFRPPFGAHNKHIDQVVQDMGIAVNDPNGPRAVESNDAEGASKQSIVNDMVTSLKGPLGSANRVPVQHDGLTKETVRTIGAMQGIVDFLNEEKLCSSTNFRIKKNGYTKP